MPELSKEIVTDGFQKQNLEVITDKNELSTWLAKQPYQCANLLFMSSGNYDGLDINNFAQNLTPSV